MITDRILIVSAYKPDIKFIQWDWIDLFDNFNRLGNFSDIIVSGDFNAQHSNWGSTTNNFARCTLSEFLIQSFYIVINDGSGTRIFANLHQVSCLMLL